MESAVLNMPANDEKNNKELEDYLEYLGNPKTIGELIENFTTSIRANEPVSLLYFKVFHQIKSGELFSIIIDAVKDARELKYIEYAFRFLNTFPEDEAALRACIDKILRLMQEKDDQFIIYEGVNLLYRICKVHPEVKDELYKNPIVVDKLTIEKTIYLMENPRSLRAHKDEDTQSSVIKSPMEFASFTLNFMAAQ